MVLSRLCMRSFRDAIVAVEAILLILRRRMRERPQPAFVKDDLHFRACLHRARSDDPKHSCLGNGHEFVRWPEEEWMRGKRIGRFARNVTPSAQGAPQQRRSWAFRNGGGSKKSTAEASAFRLTLGPVCAAGAAGPDFWKSKQCQGRTCGPGRRTTDSPASPCFRRFISGVLSEHDLTTRHRHRGAEEFNSNCKIRMDLFLKSVLSVSLCLGGE